MFLQRLSPKEKKIRPGCTRDESSNAHFSFHAKGISMLAKPGFEWISVIADGAGVTQVITAATVTNAFVAGVDIVQASINEPRGAPTDLAIPGGGVFIVPVRLYGYPSPRNHLAEAVAFGPGIPVPADGFRGTVTITADLGGLSPEKAATLVSRIAVLVAPPGPGESTQVAPEHVCENRAYGWAAANPLREAPKCSA